MRTIKQVEAVDEGLPSLNKETVVMSHCYVWNGIPCYPRYTEAHMYSLPGSGMISGEILRNRRAQKMPLMLWARSWVND